MANRQGILFLFQLQFPEESKSLRRSCGEIFSGPLASALFEGRPPRLEIIEAVFPFILGQMHGMPGPAIPSREEFEGRVAEVRRLGFSRWGGQLCQDFAALARKRQTVLLALDQALPGKGSPSPYVSGKRLELLAHLEDIFPRNLPRLLQPVDFALLQRDLQCLAIRIERMASHPAKDDLKAAPLGKHLRRLAELADKIADMSPEAVLQANAFRQMVNDYRIALFAPELKTRQPVSEKKLEAQWQAVLAGS